MNKPINLPNHVGIIMDGNGRWAVERGLSRSAGHQEGAKTLKKLLHYIYDKKIPYVSVYAFSTENFKRSQEEVNFLMNLFIKMFQEESEELKALNVKILFSGREENVPRKLLQVMRKLEQDMKNGTNGTLNICLNYGGQYEILDMTQKVAQLVLDKKIQIDEITKEVIEENLYHKLPPLDLVIRTSGELRSSNFMIYQAAYAEYYFPKTYFPDFDEKEFDIALEEFAHRKRRFGGN